MQYTFWTNTIWFVLLGIITIFEIIIVLIKAKNRKSVVALYWTIAGMTFNFEMVIFALFKSYNYYPKVLPELPFDDAIAYNPIDWYAWSEEAFEKAKREDKPILVSIGYSTCHWCHVYN